MSGDPRQISASEDARGEDGKRPGEGLVGSAARTAGIPRTESGSSWPPRGHARTNISTPKPRATANKTGANGSAADDARGDEVGPRSGDSGEGAASKEKAGAALRATDSKYFNRVAFAWNSYTRKVMKLVTYAEKSLRQMEVPSRLLRLCSTSGEGQARQSGGEARGMFGGIRSGRILLALAILTLPSVLIGLNISAFIRPSAPTEDSSSHIVRSSISHSSYNNAELRMRYNSMSRRHGPFPSKEENPWGDIPPHHRIALVTASYYHIVDGVALSLNHLVEYLVSQGHEVLVFAPHTQDPKVEYVGDLIALPSVNAPFRPEYKFSLPITNKYWRILREFSPTIVHVTSPDVVGFEAELWAKSHGIPLVCSYHTQFSSYVQYYFSRPLSTIAEAVVSWIIYMFYRPCRQVYVPTSYVADALSGQGLHNDTLKIWARGVSTADFSPAFRSEEYRLERWNVEPLGVVVLMVCRLVVEKNLGAFISVIRRLEREGIEHTSVVVGDGPARGDMERQLPNTIFYGTLRGEELSRAYASADIYFFASTSETFGSTTLEAMASGLPAVVADGASASIVVHGVCGFVVGAPPQSITVAGPSSTSFRKQRRTTSVERQRWLEERYYNATATLILDGPMRRMMGKAARARAETEFQWPVVNLAMLNYYDAIDH